MTHLVFEGKLKIALCFYVLNQILFMPFDVISYHLMQTHNILLSFITRSVEAQRSADKMTNFVT
jgi:hypothetical protein